MSAEPEFPELPDRPIPARAHRQPMPAVWVDSVVQRTMLGEYLPDEGPQRRPVEQHSGHQVQVHQLSPAPSPIPPRASAARSGLSRIRPHTAPLPGIPENDVTRMPTVPYVGSRGWRHETSAFAAKSSLPALSLFHHEGARAGQAAAPTGARQVTTEKLIDEIKTQPPVRQVTSGKLPSATGGAYEVPWTVGAGANSHFARYIASAKKMQGTYTLDLTERVRWWLLYPGRIEFLLWFGGTLLLLAITCLFLFVSLLSMGWIDNRGTAATTSASTSSARAAQPASAGTLHLLLLTPGSLQAGWSVRLEGQGFSHNAPITLTHDNNQVCEPAWIATDAQGTFTVTVLMGSAQAAWPPGPHVIRAYDTLGKRTVTITVMLVAASSSPSSAPVITVTAASNNGTGTPSTPTVGITPATTPTPKVTPTVVLTPTATVKPVKPKPSPTAGARPTAGVMPASDSHIIAPQSLSLQNGAPGPGLPTDLLLVLIVAGYCVALLLLGLAGLLHRRQHSRRANR